MAKEYTIEEYEELKQRVINLRIASTAEAGGKYHPKIWAELCELEEELSNAKLIPPRMAINDTIVIKPNLDNNNIQRKGR